MKIIFHLFCALLLLNCSTRFDSGADNQIIDFEVVLDSADFFKNENLIQIVLMSKEQEQSFLSITARYQYWTSSGKPFFHDFPEVDYENNMLIGILLGIRGIGNTKIVIDSVEQVSGKLIVNSTELLPSTHEDFIGHPAVIVKIKKPALPVVFRDIEFVEE